MEKLTACGGVKGWGGGCLALTRAGRQAGRHAAATVRTPLPGRLCF